MLSAQGVNPLMAEWALLPYDVLYIAQKLDALEDLICFSAVCRSWHEVFLLAKWNRSPIMPWLLLAEKKVDNNENPGSLRKVFNPSRRKCYELELPETIGARCWGSAHGWIVVINLGLEVFLFNPLTKARLRLPPQPTIPNQVDDDPHASPEWHRSSFVRRAIVLKTGDGDDDIIVMAVHGPGCDLAFAKPGDEAWTLVPISEKLEAVDVVSWNGRLIIMYHHGSLVYCDVDRTQDKQAVELKEFVPAPQGILDDLGPWIHGLYLVESFGDLLMVLRYKTELRDEHNPEEPDMNVFYRTLSFEVYRLNTSTNKWEDFEDLGDLALFVGDNGSMSVRASCTDNCRRNCVYFTDDEKQFWSAPKDFGGHDMGVFDMDSLKFDTFYEGGDIRSSFCTPLWFMPKLSCVGL